MSRAEDERDPAEVSLLPAAICVGVLLLGAIGAPPAQAGGRVLTTSDVIRIRVLSQPDLDTTTRVEPDGTINFPYIGRIKAAGRTEDQLERAIEGRLVYTALAGALSAVASHRTRLLHFHQSVVTSPRPFKADGDWRENAVAVRDGLRDGSFAIAGTYSRRASSVSGAV